MKSGRPPRNASIRIGTSGWHYAHWKGPFYPPGMPNAQLLHFFTGHFSTVEINNSFYRIPEEHTFAAWREGVPEGFLFAVKVNRLFTHSKKLTNPQPALDQFIARAEALGDKLGPLLFQLPPRWKLNLERLAEFLPQLPAGHRYTMEFRDASWFSDAVYELLAQHGVALCLSDLNHPQLPERPTADFTYLRLHGPGQAYRGRYDDRTLAALARRIADWRDAGIDTYCYFDNDEAGYAVMDAKVLEKKIAALTG